MRKCAYCPALFQPAGPRHIRCAECRRRNINGSSVPCSDCGALLPSAKGSLPAGDRTCQSCRRTRRDELVIRVLEARAKRSKRSPAPRLSTTARGYGSDHQRRRKEMLSRFSPGDPCVRCGWPIADPTRAHLDHTDDRTGYLGLAHARCNLAAGARNRRRYSHAS